MKVVGIIAEYNPFHRGHAYQMSLIRKMDPDAAILVVMSGNFVQRGEPAICDKMRRARMALEAGADIVLELPPAYATSSAPYFAGGAVALLKAAGCVDAVCFGAPAELEELQTLADLTENGLPDADIKAALAEGLTYPAALSSAAGRIKPEAAALLTDANNLLAIEYLKAIRAQKAAFKPICIKRSGAGHGEETLPEQGFASAGAIRKALFGGRAKEALLPYLPEKTLLQLDYILSPETVTPALSAVLLRLSRGGKDAFMPYAEVSEELAARILAERPYTGSFRELTGLIRSKNITEARVRRALLHILLDIKKEEQTAEPAALKILGLREDSFLPGLLKESTRIPIITKAADAPEELELPFLFAQDVYRQCVRRAGGPLLPEERRLSPVVVRKT